MQYHPQAEITGLKGSEIVAWSLCIYVSAVTPSPVIVEILKLRCRLCAHKR